MKNFNKPAVALLFGGRGCEHGVSVSGAEFFFPLIDENAYTKIPVYINKNGEWLIPQDENPSADIKKIVSGYIPLTPVTPALRCGAGGLFTEKGFLPLAAAVPLLHGDFGEDGVVQGALENARIPYVGCGVLSGAVISDKAYTKIIAEHLGIPTAPWILGTETEDPRMLRERAESSLGYPMFIKPSGLGSSVGSSRVRTASEFDFSYKKAAELGCGRVLIEKYISISRELECAYFKDKSKELFTDVGEIHCAGGFYDYENKYGSKSAAAVSDRAELPRDITKKIHAYSRLLVGYLGIRDLSRIDFFLSEEGELLFNEINTFPGFTGISLYPRLMERCGIPARELVRRLIEAARERGC